MAQAFLQSWAQAAYTSVGFFWMALWAFVLGYIISSLIQVFVSRKRLSNAMGQSEVRGIGLGALFGFISSSCSFSALATTKTLFQKGASFIASLAFLLASTNLVIELGIVISIFLGWQFVVGEYVGGVLLILCSWGLIKILKPNDLIKQAREKLNQKKRHHHEHREYEKSRLLSKEAWLGVARKYQMEWQMVWKDVAVGFTIAGVISVFVPDAFFEWLFIGSGQPANDLGFAEIVQQSLIAPIAAFLTFIGSMGNIPLAALLFSKGVSFAGVMAFIFSDLVVFPVLRINAKYYGWRMSAFILMLLFISLEVTSVLMHYLFEFTFNLPVRAHSDVMEQAFFELDYSFVLNIIFLLISILLFALAKKKSGHQHHEMASKGSWSERLMKILAMASFGWLFVGIVLYIFI